MADSCKFGSFTLRFSPLHFFPLLYVPLKRSSTLLHLLSITEHHKILLIFIIYRIMVSETDKRSFYASILAAIDITNTERATQEPTNTLGRL